MRQISAEIDQAQWIDMYHQRQLVAWQTRMTCAWMLKLTPDIEPESAKTFMAEINEISLDGTASKAEAAPTKKTSQGVPTRKDFYNMSDEEIERHLGRSENTEGSFEQLVQGFGRA